MEDATMSQEEVLAEIEKEIEKTKGQKDDDLEIITDLIINLLTIAVYIL